MKPFSQVASLFLASAFAAIGIGCGGPDDGFRFDGEYFADRSGFAVRIVSEGYAPDGGGTGGEAFAVVQFCPSGGAEGRPVRMTITAAKDGRAKMESTELGPVAAEWNGNTSEGLLRGLLASAGYRQIDPSELAGCLEAISRATCPKKHEHPVPPGRALRVLGEDFTEGHEIDHNRPPAEWFAQSDVPGCQ